LIFAQASVVEATADAATALENSKAAMQSHGTVIATITESKATCITIKNLVREIEMIKSENADYKARALAAEADRDLAFARIAEIKVSTF